MRSTYLIPALRGYSIHLAPSRTKQIFFGSWTEAQEAKSVTVWSQHFPPIPEFAVSRHCLPPPEYFWSIEPSTILDRIEPISHEYILVASFRVSVVTSFDFAGAMIEREKRTQRMYEVLTSEVLTRCIRRPLNAKLRKNQFA